MSEESFNLTQYREKLAARIGYGQNNFVNDDTEWLIRGLLVQEIKRLRIEYDVLKADVENYLGIFEREHGKIDES
jgi:hypothetical protein